MIESVRPAKPFDLDTATALPVPLPSRYCVIYTVPPKGPPPDRRLQRFLTQPFYVTEPFTGRPGRAVALADTIAGVRAILDGDVDDIPEEAFYMTGTLDEVRHRA